MKNEILFAAMAIAIALLILSIIAPHAEAQIKVQPVNFINCPCEEIKKVQAYLGSLNYYLPYDLSAPTIFECKESSIWKQGQAEILGRYAWSRPEHRHMLHELGHMLFGFEHSTFGYMTFLSDFNFFATGYTEDQENLIRRKQ